MPIEPLRPNPNNRDEHLKKLRELFPEVDADGRIDLEKLRTVLEDRVVPEDELETEHFGLSWPGKSKAYAMASTLSKGTMVPQPGKGVDEETTRNVFIEGENLEVLKLLKQAYKGRVKMIYIDPPYNTGKDFVYQDDFSEPVESYKRRTGQIDEEGNALTTNKKSDGRFHSKWLSMMYPRLRLARQLLRDDGVIFVSIGDDEVENLKLMLNEVFGQECFVAMFIWNTDGHTDNQLEVKVNHEYVLCYRKNTAVDVLNDVIDPSTTKDSNLWKGFAENSITKNGPKNPPTEIILKKGFPCKVSTLDLPRTEVDASFFTEVDKVRHISREITRKHGCSYPVRLDPMVVKNGKLANDCRVFAGWANNGKLERYMDSGFQPIVEEDGVTTFYLSANGVIYYHKKRDAAKNILSVLRNFTTTEKMRSQLETEGVYFTYPKPVDLITYLLELGLKSNDIVLDFFSGSATTGHALYEYNAKEERGARFILVQMHETTGVDSLARQKGFETIDEISIHRLQVFAKKLDNGVGDFGFAAYSFDRSNFRAWNNVEGADLTALEKAFAEAESPLVEGWNWEGLRTEVMLMEGFPLDSRVEQVKELKKNRVERIHHEWHAHRLLVCLDKKVAPETIEALKLDEGDIFICLDAAIDAVNKVRLSDKGLIKTI